MDCQSLQPFCGLYRCLLLNVLLMLSCGYLLACGIQVLLCGLLGHLFGEQEIPGVSVVYIDDIACLTFSFDILSEYDFHIINPP